MKTDFRFIRKYFNYRCGWWKKRLFSNFIAYPKSHINCYAHKAVSSEADWPSFGYLLWWRLWNCLRYSILPSVIFRSFRQNTPIGDLLIKLVVDVGHRHFRFRFDDPISLRVKPEVAFQQIDPTVYVLDGDTNGHMSFRRIDEYLSME
jgi:hypothetical protein